MPQETEVERDIILIQADKSSPRLPQLDTPSSALGGRVVSLQCENSN